MKVFYGLKDVVRLGIMPVQYSKFWRAVLIRQTRLYKPRWMNAIERRYRKQDNETI